MNFKWKKISINNRIREIRDEQKLSNKKLEMMTGISDDTIGRIVKGKNSVKSDQIQKFAEAFGITVERLKQTDGIDDKVAKTIFGNYHDNVKISIATDFLQNFAIGATEVSDGYRYKGIAHAMSGEFDNAEKAFIKSIEFAKKTGCKHRLQRAINNYLTCIADAKRVEKWSEAFCIVKDVEMITENLEENGKYKQNLGMYLYWKGEVDAAIESYQDASSYYEEVGNSVLVGRIKHSMADIEFHRGNLQKSKDLLLSARKFVKEDSIKMQLIVEKDLARVLVCMGKEEDSLTVINEAVKHPSIDNYTDLLSKFLLVKCDILKSRSETYNEAIAIGEKAINCQGICNNTRANISDNLFLLYMKVGDADKSIMYHCITRDSISGGFTNYKRGVWF